MADVVDSGVAGNGAGGEPVVVAGAVTAGPVASLWGRFSVWMKGLVARLFAAGESGEALVLREAREISLGAVEQRAAGVFPVGLLWAHKGLLVLVGLVAVAGVLIGRGLA